MTGSTSQYKALQADTYGSLPADSYTDSIGPTQPAASSGATLTFTPLIAGYWAVSVSCGVTVTDTQTSQYWSGSGNAGPKYLASYDLSAYAGTPKANGSRLNVCVGETIPLEADPSPSDMRLRWSVPGQAIVEWGPKTNQTMQQSAVISPLPTQYLSQDSFAFYWMDTDSGSTDNETVKVVGTLGNGQSTPLESMTFNVFRPRPAVTASYPGAITLENPFQEGGYETLYDGDDPSSGDWGVAFYFNIPSSAFGNTYDLWTAQIALSLSVITEQYDADTQKTYEFAFTLPSSKLPGPLLDTHFPYEYTDSSGTDYENDGTDLTVWDAPYYSVYPLPSGYGFGPGSWSTYDVEITEDFAQMLLFEPPEPYEGTYAPLQEVGWGWTADAANPKNSGFYLKSSAKVPISPPTGIDLVKLPEWNNNAADPTNGWGDPDWTLQP